MARTDKYYGTNVIIGGNMIDKLRSLGYEGSRWQFRIVCKAKSRADANRKAESYGLGKNVFHPNYTSETGNKIELKECDKYGFIVCLNGTMGDDFVGIESVL